LSVACGLLLIMGVRFEYFSGVREQITPKLVEDGPSQLDYVGGPDPSVALGLLGEQLTGVSFLEIGGSVKSWSRQVEVPGDPVEKDVFFYDHGLDPEATPEELEHALMELSWGVSIEELDDRMRDALAAVPHDGRRSVAGRWATIEELEGWSADEVLAVLVSLCTLARNAVEREHHLYCRTML
jgi:hypothetical protein